MKPIKCHGCGKETEVHENYVAEYCCRGLPDDCYCYGEPINPVFCDDCEKKFQEAQGGSYE